MNLSRIISGTMNWGTWGVNYSKHEMRQLISESFYSGINAFDHADIYGGYTTEKSFGEVTTAVTRNVSFEVTPPAGEYSSDSAITCPDSSGLSLMYSANFLTFSGQADPSNATV